MKKIIVILFTIILAVYIGTSLIIGDGASSFKSQSSTIVNNSSTQITNMDMVP